MSNKKFISRTAFILATIALVAAVYAIYIASTNSYKIESLETRISHIEGFLDVGRKEKA
jgi:hypothetical protein